MECLNEWTNSYGFPKGGSLSTKEVKKLKGKLREAEDKLKKKKTVVWLRMPNMSLPSPS